MVGEHDTTRLRWPFFVLLAGAGSEAGHLIAYLVRFGHGGLARQGQGIHAYFPSLVGALSCVLGASALVCLLVLALARLGRGRRQGKAIGCAPPLLDTLAILFTVQIALYGGQETAEAVAAGAPHPGALDLLLWGSLGQLPAALLGALALRWLTVRISAALAELTAPPDPIRPWTAIPPPTRLRAHSEAIALLADALVVFAKRGPPGPLPVGS